MQEDSGNLIGAEEVTTTTTTTRRVAAKLSPVWQDPMAMAQQVGPVSPKTRDQRHKRVDKAVRQEKLLAGPQAGSGVLPLSGKDLDQFRGPKEFMNAARQHLVPSEVGKAFADTLMHALQHREVAMLKVLLPYVMGPPPETEVEGMGDEAVKGLIGAILGGPSLGKPAPDPNRTKRKYTKRQIVQQEDAPIGVIEEQ